MGLRIPKRRPIPGSQFSCPNPECESHAPGYLYSHYKCQFVANKRYTRKNGEIMTSYLCRVCKKYFSDTNDPERAFYKYRESPDSLKQTLLMNVGGVSMNHIANATEKNKDTVEKNIKHVAKITRALHEKALGVKAIENLFWPVQENVDYVELEFDEQETYFYSKLLPVSILTFVDRKSGFCVGFRIAQFGARRNREEAVAVHGEREDLRRAAFESLCEDVKRFANGRKMVICTDRKREYNTWFRECLPRALHYQVLSVYHEENRNLNRQRRVYEHRANRLGWRILSTNYQRWGTAVQTRDGSILIRFRANDNGRGRLVALSYERRYDHLYRLNHYFAMARKNMARLGRKSLSVTQKMEALNDFLWNHLGTMNRYPLCATKTFYFKPTRSHGYIRKYHPKHKRLFERLRATWAEIQREAEVFE